MRDLLRAIVAEDALISREKYLNAAVLVPFFQRQGEPWLLFEKRSQHVRQAGEISFPGGAWEQGDVSFQETAVRETIEELGIAREQIEVLGKVGTLVTPGGVLVEAYLGLLDVVDVSALVFDRREVEYLVQVPLQYLRNHRPRCYRLVTETHPYSDRDGERIDFPAKELALPERYHRPWRGRDREVYLYCYEDEVIWGITGEILHEVLRRLLSCSAEMQGLESIHRQTRY